MDLWDTVECSHRSLGSGTGSVDWIDVAENRDRWRAFVNAVMNLKFASPCIIIHFK